MEKVSTKKAIKSFSKFSRLLAAGSNQITKISAVAADMSFETTRGIPKVTELLTFLTIKNGCP